ncbi:MAG: UMP kinase [Clostridia bacterium]|nr:UMP kinase [Clostridia bacterium]
MYKSALIKLSGEALAGENGILNGEFLARIAAEVKKCVESGARIAMVIGGGNIWRGARQSGVNVTRFKADHMGMMATLINSIAMQDYLEQAGLKAKVLSAVPVQQFCEPYSQQRALDLLDEGYVVLCSCGVGYPYFSTDTGVVLRAAELGIEIILSAKSVDGVYDKDPRKYPDAVKYDKVSYDTILKEGLGVIDLTSAALARENHIKMLLFSLADPENIYRAIKGEKLGTVIE